MHVGLFCFCDITSERPLTFDAATAGLENPGVHVGLGVRQQLVPGQVRVVRGGDEIVAQGLIHVLVHVVVQRVENIARWTAHEACKTWKETKNK